MEKVEKQEGLGDRMKAYEEKHRSYVDHTLPLVMRLDGHAFSKFTRGLKRPYEEWLHKTMVKVTATLVNDYNAVLGYTQSDEITLVFLPQTLEGVHQPYIFNNQIQKLVSLAAGNATNILTMEILFLIHSGEIKQEDYKPDTYKKLTNPRAYFDARIFNVPSLAECYNCVYWRATYDCIRNSVNSTAQTHCSHKSLQNLTTKEVQEKLLKEKGIDWEAMDPEFKYGTFVKKKIVIKTVDNQDQEEEGEQEEVKEDKDKEEEVTEKVKVDKNKKVKVESVQRRKLYAFALKMPKYEEKYEEAFFSKYYQEDNEELKKLVGKEYLVE